MIQLEYTQNLHDAGLSPEQATIYEVLLKIGISPASPVAKAVSSGLSRPLIYKVLDALISMNLAEKHDIAGKVTTFSAKHPTAILERIDIRKAQIEKTKAQFAITSSKLASLFNLTAGRPGVQYFEGKDGVWDVLMDSLTATEEILTYADLEAIAKYIPDLNAEYSVMREEKHVQKRGLVLDSPLSRSFLASYDSAVTHTKLIPASEGTLALQTIMQIYDNKVSYITLTDAYMVGIIITDQFIANTHKYLFESMWKTRSGEMV